jgi:DNA-directed RNA polymerase specialized sigma24 family protein
MARRVRIDLWRKVRQLDQAIRIDPAAAQAGLPGVIRDIEDPELFDPVTDLELERLLECIAKLPPPLRDLVYKRLQGIPLRELVGMFGDSIPTVYRRYQKALWQIRECMGLIQPAAQGRVN